MKWPLLDECMQPFFFVHCLFKNITLLNHLHSVLILASTIPSHLFQKSHLVWPLCHCSHLQKLKRKLQNLKVLQQEKRTFSCHLGVRNSEMRNLTSTGVPLQFTVKMVFSESLMLCTTILWFPHYSATIVQRNASQIIESNRLSTRIEWTSICIESSFAKFHAKLRSKIRENKERNSPNFVCITFAQYCKYDNENSRRNHRRGKMFKLTTELINILKHFNVLEADHFTVQLKEVFIQK